MNDFYDSFLVMKHSRDRCKRNNKTLKAKLRLATDALKRAKPLLTWATVQHCECSCDLDMAPCEACSVHNEVEQAIKELE